MRGLPEYEGAPTDEVRGATRSAFRNMVDLAIEEEVDFIIIAGDIYDGDWRDFNTGLFFRAEMARLKNSEILVFIVLGNHDAESRITKKLNLPDNVHQFSSQKAETQKIEDLKVALHGQSYKAADTKDNLAVSYPPPAAGYYNIGVLHTAAEGREGHAPYAPCSVAELSAKEYDYWALGHVHQREILSENPFIVFPGNLQGRHIKETATEGKGCTLVTVDDAGIASLSHKAVDTVRWAQVEVDLVNVTDMGTLLDRVRIALDEAFTSAGGCLLAARVTLNGNTKLHGRLLSDHDGLLAEIRGVALDVAVGEVWIEKVVILTFPETSIEELAKRKDVLGDVSRELEALQEDPIFRETLKRALGPLFEKLPFDLIESDLGREKIARDDDALARLTTQAGEVVISKLAGVKVEE